MTIDDGFPVVGFDWRRYDEIEPRTNYAPWMQLAQRVSDRVRWEAEEKAALRAEQARRLIERRG